MSSSTQRYALLGWPVKHSVSPQMQEAGFGALGIEATYELIEVAPEGIPACLQRLVEEGYSGWNVTVPHKEQVASLLEDVSPEAAAAGSVNTVINREGQLSGYSTDGYGLARSVEEEFSVPLTGRRFLFLGTGGAARATSVYFALHGAAEIVLVNRTPAKAETLAEVIREGAPACRVKVIPLEESGEVASVLGRMDVLIQSTSLGLHADDPMPMEPALVPDHVSVVDMIYGHTPFRVALGERGIRTIDGRGMLLYQGVRSFELWTGQQAPVDVMRAALDAALDKRDKA